MQQLLPPGTELHTLSAFVEAPAPEVAPDVGAGGYGTSGSAGGAFALSALELARQLTVVEYGKHACSPSPYGR